MCGICGIVALGGGNDNRDRRSDVSAMVTALRHRGPDDIGIASDRYATLGLARLAIRGLADGKQPVVDPDTGVMAVCNGEIDNHAELRAWLAERGRSVRQDTDVAVLPGMYLELGEAFVERLAGAFAIAVWDPRAQRLVLARDRAGERPLFLRRDGGDVLFASELSAMVLADGPRPALDRDALIHFLRFGHFQNDRSPLADVRRVGPAEVLVADSRGVSQRRYWRWQTADTAPAEPSVETFEPVFRQAVLRQSAVDVEVGIFLSGGVDSSLIAAVAARERPETRLKAFTLRFDEESYDEGTWAEQVATSLGLEPVNVPVRPDDVPGTLADLIRHCGEPLADPAWIPTMLLAKQASEDVRVVLGGEGGDELFGGYPTYLGALAAKRYARLPAPLRALVRKGVERWPVSDKKVTLSFLLKRFVQAADLDAMSRHLVWTSNIPPRLLRRLGLEGPVDDGDAGAADSLADIQRHDVETSLAEGLLTKADRACMRWGLESRAPFLDVAVMDYAAGLPSPACARGLSTKIFLKRFAERHLPKSIVHRRKRGLSVPLSGWLRGPLKEWAEERLSSHRLADFGVDAAQTAVLLHEHCARRADHARVLWTLIVFSEWLEWAAGRRSKAGGR